MIFLHNVWCAKRKKPRVVMEYIKENIYVLLLSYAIIENERNNIRRMNIYIYK